MKKLSTRPHPRTYITEQAPQECIKDIRDKVFTDSPSLPLQFRRQPEVIDSYGEMDGYGNIQIRFGTTSINYKLFN